jgi:dihydrofolate synthase/folylpolyglutamate synthase
MIKKNLNTWLEYLEAIHPTEIDMGLARVKSVAEKMDLIKPAAKVILVAGTNGKGSTVTYCRYILAQSGLSVGAYMSPHLHVYNERVTINNQMVSDADLVESFEAIELAREHITLTYFEFGTLSALYLFKKYEVDVAVIEVGLGGRLDATNIVDPDVSVVTSIGLDHQDWLGDDLSQIAFEKAGVFRSGKGAVCGQVNVDRRLIEHAAAIGAKLLVKNRDFHIKVAEQSWTWNGKGADNKGADNKGTNKDICFGPMPLPKLPLENAGTALQALMCIYPELEEKHIVAGFHLAQLPGRLQSINKPFKGVLDVGHNPQAAQLVAKEASHRVISGKRYCLLAMLNDKDALGVVAELKDVVDVWHIAGIQGYRGQSAQGLQDKVSGMIAGAKLHFNVADGLDSLLSELTDGDEVLVLGSFITVANAQKWLEGQLNG